MTAEDLADLLRHKRTAAALTQSELAEYVGVSQNTLSLWERGESLSTVSAYLSTIEVLGYDIVLRPATQNLVPRRGRSTRSG